MGALDRVVAWVDERRDPIGQWARCDRGHWQQGPRCHDCDQDEANEQENQQ